MPDHAKAVAYVRSSILRQVAGDHGEQFGSGTLLYEGTYLSDALQKAVLRDALRKSRAERG